MLTQTAYASVAALTGAETDTWANPNNALGVDNGTYAAGAAGITASTKTLNLKGFGFSLPVGSIVKGIRVIFTAKRGSIGGRITAALIFNGVIANTPKTYDEANALPHQIALGSPTDLWGTSGVAVADWNHANFGVSVQLTDVAGDIGATFDLDAAWIEISYLPPNAGVTGTTPTGGISTVTYATNELAGTPVSVPGILRAAATNIAPKTFATGALTLAPLTPVTYNTSTNKWQIFTGGGSNGTGVIQGFVWPDQIVLDGTNDVLGQVMMAGDIYYSDIPIVVASYSEAQLKAALTAGGVRKLGFRIQGLEKFY